MKCSIFTFFTFVFLAFLIFSSNTQAQNRRRFPPKVKNSIVAQTTNAAVVVDERLAVLRFEPSLFSKAVIRMQNGRKISILGSKEADGVTFYRVTAPPNNYGWVQAEAIVGKFRRGDDARLAKLVQSSDGFEQIERAQIFLENFKDSSLRPAILLLMGDLMEETALRLSNEATRRLDRREMAASGAPLHSFYLNYLSLNECDSAEEKPFSSKKNFTLTTGM
jgi:transposase-like protein